MGINEFLEKSAEVVERVLRFKVYDKTTPKSKNNIEWFCQW